ncbi:MAG: hypothetical protein DSZ03_05560 [Sulfurimonas sp.]|nr:MAG: hypothetical protein DSZ03_05560 [Sulfurimonas sp.]
MCDFNHLDDAAKTDYHHQLIACATALGGKNFFLHMLEAIRRTKPHPLMAKQCAFHFSHGSIVWDKVIFQDKLTLLSNIRIHEAKQKNLLPKQNHQSYKKIRNLVRTLHPITFHVTPKQRKDGEGFHMKALDVLDEQTTRLNPVFDAVFFCSVDTVKKILAYEPRQS